MDRRLLRHARRRAGITVDEVAKAASLPYDRVYQVLEAGRLKWTPEVEVALRKAVVRLLGERARTCEEMLEKVNAA